MIFRRVAVSIAEAIAAHASTSAPRRVYFLAITYSDMLRIARRLRRIDRGSIAVRSVPGIAHKL